MIVQITLHVNLENVSILVQNQMCVLQMQIVELQNMSQYALVQMDLWAHQNYLAQDVSEHTVNILETYILKYIPERSF